MNGSRNGLRDGKEDHRSRSQPKVAAGRARADEALDLAPDGALDSALTWALEARPNPRVPVDFAARVLRALPPHASLPVATAPVPRAGRRAVFAALAVLFTGMLIVAPQSRALGNLAWIIVEYVLAAEFILISLWVSLRPANLR